MEASGLFADAMVNELLRENLATEVREWLLDVKHTIAAAPQGDLR